MQSTTPTSTPPQFWQRARHFHGLFWEPFSYLQIHGVHSGGLFPESRRRHPLSRRRIGGTWCLHPPGQRSEVREVFEDDAAMLASLVLSLVTSPKAWVSRGFPLCYFPSLIWKDLFTQPPQEQSYHWKYNATVCLSWALVVHYRFRRAHFRKETGFRRAQRQEYDTVAIQFWQTWSSSLSHWFWGSW